MEIPSSHAGVVKELKVQLGDKVAEGTVVLTLEGGEGAAAAPAARGTSAAPARSKTGSSARPTSASSSQ
jgi:pyruvate/2-oxoglutarate dehydrogenase complex dihydrolipoamide acyltransferase (E2) component